MDVTTSDGLAKINIIHSVYNEFMPELIYSPYHRKLLFRV